MNGTHKILVYGENISPIKRNNEALLQASMEVGLEVNTEKI
jgi:hypothetical protein